MENKEYLEKAINTSLGGQLNADDIDQFFDGVRNKAGFLSKIQWIGTDAGSIDLQFWNFLESDVLAGVEGTTPTHIGSGSISEKTITLKEAVLGYDITYNFFNHNVMGSDVDGFVTEKMSDTLRNVIAANYITGSTVNGTRQYGIFDGLIKTMKADTSIVSSNSTASATSPYEVALKSAFDSLDDKYKYVPEADLVYLVPWGFASGWKKEAGDRTTSKGDQYLFSYGTPDYWGIPVVPVGHLKHNDTNQNPIGNEFVLTSWDNLKIGYSNRYGQFGFGVQDQQRKRLVEYTLNAYIGMNYVDSELVIFHKVSGSLA